MLESYSEILHTSEVILVEIGHAENWLIADSQKAAGYIKYHVTYASPWVVSSGFWDCVCVCWFTASLFVRSVIHLFSVVASGVVAIIVGGGVVGVGVCIKFVFLCVCVRYGLLLLLL